MTETTPPTPTAFPTDEQIDALEGRELDLEVAARIFSGRFFRVTEAWGGGGRNACIFVFAAKPDAPGRSTICVHSLRDCAFVFAANPDVVEDCRAQRVDGEPGYEEVEAIPEGADLKIISDFPHYSTDPAAADLVRAHIIQQWEYEEGTDQQPGTSGRFYCQIHGSESGDIWGATSHNIFVSRCRAALKAALSIVVKVGSEKAEGTTE